MWKGTCGATTGRGEGEGNGHWEGGSRGHQPRDGIFLNNQLGAFVIRIIMVFVIINYQNDFLDLWHTRDCVSVDKLYLYSYFEPLRHPVLIAASLCAQGGGSPAVNGGLSVNSGLAEDGGLVWDGSLAGDGDPAGNYTSFKATSDGALVLPVVWEQGQ